jgi:serine/threonine protein kinase
MVMTLLGASLSELRRHSTEQCFSLSTALRASLQILDAIQSVHSIGFLHRDIKPSNFAIGMSNVRQIVILDFGLARKYTDDEHRVRPARAEAGFRGRRSRSIDVRSFNYRSMTLVFVQARYAMHRSMPITIENWADTTIYGAFSTCSLNFSSVHFLGRKSKIKTRSAR